MSRAEQIALVERFASQELMKASDPVGWATLAAEMNLAQANHEALNACREAAQRTKKEKHCSIVVPALP